MVEKRINEDSDPDDRSDNSVSSSGSDSLMSEESGDGEHAAPAEPIEALNPSWEEIARMAHDAARNIGSEELNATEPEPPPGVAGKESWPPGQPVSWPPVDTMDPFSFAIDVPEVFLPDKDTPAPAVDQESPLRTSDEDAESEVHVQLAQLHEELRESREREKENLELAQRKQAELVNFRKRLKQESEEYRKRAIESLLVDLLPVADSLEKALSSLTEQETDSPFVDGMRKTLQLLESTLVRYGVTAIRDVMVAFDPELHIPLLVEESDEHEDGTVLAVFQPGYKLADKLVRPAMVKVARRDTHEDAGKQESAFPEKQDTEEAATLRALEAGGDEEFEE